MPPSKESSPANFSKDFSPGIGVESNASLAAGGNPQYTANWMNAPFQEVYKEVCQQLKPFFEAPHDAQVVLCPGSGTDGLESATRSLFKSGDNVLFCTNGKFGESWMRQGEDADLKIHQFKTRDGDGITPHELTAHLENLKSNKTNLQGICIVQVDGSMGVHNPVANLASAARSVYPEALIGVDAVSGMGAHSVGMKDQIDFAIGVPNKSLGGKAGFWIGCFGNRAIDAAHKNKNEARKRAGNRNLSPILEGASQGKAPATINTSAIYGLKDTIEPYREREGDWFKEKHQLAEHLRAGLEKMGFQMFTRDGSHSDTCIAAIPPKGIDAKKFQENLESDHGFQIYGSLGGNSPTSQFLRMGLVGDRKTEHADALLEGMQKTRDKMLPPATHDQKTPTAVTPPLSR